MPGRASRGSCEIWHQTFFAALARPLDTRNQHATRLGSQFMLLYVSGDQKRSDNVRVFQDSAKIDQSVRALRAAARVSEVPEDAQHALSQDPADAPRAARRRGLKQDLSPQEGKTG